MFKYLEFLKEKDNNNLGLWIESIYDDYYVKNIVNRFISEIKPDIRLSNAINLLDENQKSDIKSQIDEYLANGITDKDTDILVSTQIDESVEVTSAGKAIFISFLKSLTALGLKEIGANMERCPSQFLTFYYYENLVAEEVKSIFLRFKSLSRYLELIDYGKNDTALYFGLKCDGTLEYGVAYDKLTPIGQFKLSNGVVKWILGLDSKSAASFKKDIVNLTYTDIITLGKIKMDMKDFKPGYFEKESKPIITDKIISFGYYGVGKWGNGKMDESDFSEVKNAFTQWILTKKWGSKVLVSVKAQSFWIYLNIKIK